MPRKGKGAKHGGKRAGKPQTAYANRTDLTETKELPTSTTGNEYGERKRREEAVKAVPLPKNQAAVPARPRQPVLPGEAVPGGLAAPTTRPTEPVTAGVPIGAGPGPRTPTPGQAADDDVVSFARALYQFFPHPELGEMIEAMDRRLSS